MNFCRYLAKSSHALMNCAATGAVPPLDCWFCACVVGVGCGVCCCCCCCAIPVIVIKFKNFNWFIYEMSTILTYPIVQVQQLPVLIDNQMNINCSKSTKNLIHLEIGSHWSITNIYKTEKIPVNNWAKHLSIH